MQRSAVFEDELGVEERGEMGRMTGQVVTVISA